MTEYALRTHIGDSELPVTVEFEYLPGLPAKTNAPMEDCYPAEEGEIEISEVLTGWDNIIQFRYDIADLLEDSWIKHIEQKCLDYIAETGEA